ncbi:hypothetical protein GGX14DRAFT_400212 [Mycena pura]|uniref:Uncharacterized protein n=1 Tax=Mycena pura TaxID=153505 RepID=A0AAD6V2R8_9AGAR|nr:hypothetical protein GGX14DRAFT_400212 [Mycena pura]
MAPARVDEICLFRKDDSGGGVRELSSKGGEIDEAAWTDRLLPIMAFLDYYRLVGCNAQPEVPRGNGPTQNRANPFIRQLMVLLKQPLALFPHRHCVANSVVERICQASRHILWLDDYYELFPTAGVTAYLESIVDPRVQKPNCNNAMKLLTFVSKHLLPLYNSHMGELIKGVADEKHPALLRCQCRRWLQLFARTRKWCLSTSRRTLEHIKRLALDGTSRQAKFAARFLVFSKKPTICKEVVDVICESLGSTTPEAFLAHIAVLAQFARFAPDVLEHKSDVLMTFLLKGLLMIPTHPHNVAQWVMHLCLVSSLNYFQDVMGDEEWAVESEVSDNLRAKSLALKRRKMLWRSRHQDDGNVTRAQRLVYGAFPRRQKKLCLAGGFRPLYHYLSTAYAKAIAPIFEARYCSADRRLGPRPEDPRASGLLIWTKHNT